MKEALIKKIKFLKKFVINAFNQSKIFSLALFKRLKDLARKTGLKIKMAPRKITSIFFENVYGVWIVKKWASLFGYVLLFLICLVCIIFLDQFVYTRQFIHSEGANEAVIGVITILLALLIPVAIALIEDARQSPLARQTIVKSIIRFNLAPLVLLIVCVFFFIPQGLHITGESVTLKNGYTAILACCILFIFSSFYRSYKWLSDGSTYSSGVPQTPSGDDPQPEAFFSYRFARIVRLLSGAKGYETWMTIWSQWFPAEYEDVLHAAFFKREFGILKNKKTKRYIVLSLEVEAYDKYFKKRNENSWRFELEYVKQFLLMYGSVEGIIADNRRVASGLWRAKSALERINTKAIDSMMTRSRAWNLFEAMGEYVKSRGLLKPKTSSRSRGDSIVSVFLEKYFDAITEDSLNSYELETYFQSGSPWAVTYDNLYKNHYTLSFMVADDFKEWLFKQLDNTKKPDARTYEIDGLLNNLFPETDPITMGHLYWMLYQSKNTTDSKLIVELNYKEPRPIGHIGRSSSFWVEDEDAQMKNFALEHAEQEDGTIKLFATMYASYFRSFWKLDEIIKTARAIDTSNLEEYEAKRLEAFINLMVRIKKFYKKLDTNNKK